MSKVKILKVIAALVVVSALLAPTANGQPIDPPGVGAGKVTTASHYQTSPVATENSGNTDPNGFDWGDAFVGALGALIAMFAGAACIATLRRTRSDGKPVVAG